MLSGFRAVPDYATLHRFLRRLDDQMIFPQLVFHAWRQQVRLIATVRQKS